jgi:FixJ family two-component response regulator
VIVTGLYRGAQYRHEAISSFGASDYFEKPYDSEKLLNSVLNLLNEEEEIEEDLPDSASIMEKLSQRIKS